MNKLLKKILVTCNTLRSQFFTYAGSVDDIEYVETNHSLMRLEPDREYQIFIYYYMGSDHDACEFWMWLSYIDETVEQLYYDMFVPFQACRDVYTENSYEFANTVKVLEQACNMLDLNYPYTEAYYDRICQAGKFLKEEYYEKMCGNSPVTVNCIGHTHIDVAWLWTLAQTREKVQRSFATVLELLLRLL